MTKDLVSLNMGDGPVAIAVAEDVTETSEKSQPVIELADYMADRYLAGEPWSLEKIKEFSSSDLIRAANLFVDVAAERGHPLSPYEGDDIVRVCCSPLGIIYRRFFQWTFEVRVGLRPHLSRLKNAVAMTFIPRRGLLCFNKQTREMGEVRTAVMYIRGGKKGRVSLCFRGYSADFDEDTGDCIVGGAAYNSWSKDPWTTPGLVDPEKIADRKELVAADRERLLAKFAKRREGADAAQFTTPRALRLDLENPMMFIPALHLIRALRSRALVEAAYEQIDLVTSTTTYGKDQIMQQPELAGDHAARICRALETIESASAYYHEVGQFIMPEYYLGVSNPVPPSLSAIEGHMLDGVTVKCLPATAIATRQDRRAIVRSPAALRKLERFTPVLSHCSQRKFKGRRVADGLYEWQEPNGEPVDAACRSQDAQWMATIRYEGEEDPVSIPVAVYESGLRFSLVPQVMLNYGARRIAHDTLVFHAGGAAVDLEAINPGFVTWERTAT